VGILLSAAADTTVITLANTLRAFSEFPEEFQRVKADPSLTRAAFEESLRWDSPSRMAGRITTRDIEIEDYVIPAGTRCGLMFAAANRDPRRWQDPYRFDVKRSNAGHLGFGFGVHACVGRVLALLEAEALLGAVASSVTRIEPAGKPEPWITTVGHGPIKLPVRLSFS
jgi:cytochrome P450